MSAEITQQLKRDLKDLFPGIGSFYKMFSLQVKPDSKPYQTPQRCVVYALQKSFKEWLEQIQQQDIITPLGMNEIVEWCNSFILVPMSNGKLRLYMDPARLNQTLIRPVHRGPALNNILPKLNNAQYLSLINVSSGCYNLKLDERSSYLTTFTCQTGRYRYKRLPLGAAPAGYMLQRKIDEIFKDLPNVFGISDDILVVGYDIKQNRIDLECNIPETI